MLRSRYLVSVFFAACSLIPTPALAQDSPAPNFDLAERFSPSYVNQRIQSTAVSPKWIGETDRFWYSYRTASGTRYNLVDPVAGTKVDLFDHVKLSAELSMAVKRPLDANSLTLQSASMDDEGTLLSFRAEKLDFELVLATGELRQVEPEEKEPSPPRRSEEEMKFDPRKHRNFSPDRTAYVFIDEHNLYYVEASDEVKQLIGEIEARMEQEELDAAKEEAGEGVATKEVELVEGVEKVEKVEESEIEGKQETSEKNLRDSLSDWKYGESDTDLKGDVDDKKDKVGEEIDKLVEQLVDENLKGEDDKKTTELATTEAEGDPEDQSKDEPEVDERELWADDVDESKAVQLSDDGEEDYEFSSGGRFSRGAAEYIEDEDAYLEGLQAGIYLEPSNLDPQDDEVVVVIEDDVTVVEGDGTAETEVVEVEEPVENKRVQPRVTWAADSSAFRISRYDSRGVGELFLVNSLTKPRPSLETYNYPLPGEENIGHSELFVFDRTRTELFQIEGKWTDESYQNIHWAKQLRDLEEDEEHTDEEIAGIGDEIRFLRRDRLLRNVELCSVNVRTGELKTLLEEGFEGANLSPQSVRYLKDRDDMIWWSERSGWAHFYLYGQDGTFKNAITSGTFRASRIVEVDEDKGLIYFLGNAREPGENVYHQHLYRAFLDGSDLTLLNPGDANHRSVLSPTKNFTVDNSSRVDMAPTSTLRNAAGEAVMTLEDADLTRLYDAGWTMPQTFTFKAADGVTDLYGNMWKPFDFDPSLKYPIIAEVYPGPQTEGVSHSFSATNARQQLAQVGFIVVQLGHRGGTPGRSKSYHSFGYSNLRDYGLADKKAGLEQLAERHPYIDIDKVGIYGHSGGGFMTAAALLREPYNDFFKVGVASSGNHDNNVYGRHWAERYHGLTQVDEVVKKEEEQAVAAAEGDEEVKETKTTFKINVPTNAELAANLKGHLLLTHGDMDNNVHPAGTVRLVDALIKANKRFDMLILPGKRHSYGDYNNYFTQRKWEYFAEHLLGDYQPGADILQKD
ncbi:MAG: dipeptidyl-peptidase-4 [Gammaproteobacteria bacterium]|jgi:dipeptidyl-peptidase-4